MIIAVVAAAIIAGLVTLIVALVARYCYRKKRQQDPIVAWQEKLMMENYCATLKDPAFGSIRSTKNIPSEGDVANEVVSESVS